MSKKSILFIVPLPPPIHGSAMMSQYIKESKLINEAFECDFVNLSTSRRMDEIGKKPLLKMLRFVWTYCIVLGKLMCHRYDLCYLAITCHGIGFLKDAPFVLLCKLFGKRIVIHQHNKGMMPYIDKWPYKWLLPLVYRETKVILLSRRLYPDIERIVQNNQILICPNGIPGIWGNELNFKRHNKIPRLLFLSNLMESKGVLVLLDVLEVIRNKGFSFVCDFIGGETSEIDVHRFEREVKKRNLNESVFYHGKKIGKEKQEYFINADVFVHPTMNDCFPLVLLEAMQYKLPIVSTNVGGIADIIDAEINGYICEKQNVDDFVNRLINLLCNESLRVKMGEAGFEKYKSHYTLNRFEIKIKDCLLASM